MSTEQPTLDPDPIETEEWLDALGSVVEEEGVERAQFILQRLFSHAEILGARVGGQLQTPYTNTLSPEAQPAYPGDQAIEDRITAVLRWNAIAMVLRADSELGGHLSTYASAALLYEVGFHHFFHAATESHGGDLMYIQGHVSPGIYARGFLEGRFTEAQLENFRKEVEIDGLSSYPHPYLMSDYWQFATVSMGLGALLSIYQARFLKYLANRELAETQNRKVWVFCGDGEMDEPESLGALSVAAREQLDNLIFVVNCNLQRLDGPVRGNAKIIQELEGVFRGAGWNVIKVIWSGDWDPLLAQDHHGLLRQRMESALDGDYLNYEVHGGAVLREAFFGTDPALAAMVADYSDEALADLRRGGHDVEKVYAAYQQAVEHTGQPTVILVKTVKGYGLGTAGEGLNTAHQSKKMNVEQLKAFRDRFDLPLSDTQLENIEFYHPGQDSEEIQYLQKRREALGGYLPARRPQTDLTLPIPDLSAFESVLKGSGDREISTTMAFVRVLNVLLKDKALRPHIVPIVPDETRTFGMEGLFRQIGIYSVEGQQYQPSDAGQVMYYHEAKDGQLLEEGISEPGAMSSWIAAATSYSVNNLPMIPFYIYYSMFGFQRVGDLAWAAGDMQARGFLLGATAGRTTLAGEGLQHTDGHSHIQAALIPNCRAYDPTYAYELAVIIQDGMRRMMVDQENVFYYLTLMNENYHQPALPEGVESGIIKGMYQLKSSENNDRYRVQLLGSGAILREVLKAAELLEADCDVLADVWSVTSFTELAREANALARHHRYHPEQLVQNSYVTVCLSGVDAPVIAATDYIKAYPEQIREFVPQPYVTLGTDGFGRSDTREVLRYFFEVDYKAIAYTALHTLVEQGTYPKDKLLRYMQQWEINPDKPNPREN